MQSDGEPIDHFLLDIRKLVKTCEFGDQQESMLRDKVVLGTNNKKLQQKMLEKNDLTYVEAAEMGRAAEISSKQSKEVQKESLPAVNAIDKYKFNKIKPKTIHNNSKADNKKCKSCNFVHKFKNCPAYGKKCNNCKQLNHFAICCFSNKNKNVSNISMQKKEEIYYINSVSENISNNNNQNSNFRNKSWVDFIEVNDKLIEFKLDSGSEVNIIPYSIFKKVNKDSAMSSTTVILKTYGGHEIKPIGMCSFTCKYKNEVSLETFIIINQNLVPILGLDTCVSLGLIKKIHSVEKNLKNLKEKFVNKNKDVFVGLGSFPRIA